MATAINPVSYSAFIMPVDASGTGNILGESAANDFSIAAFEKILAFGSQPRQASNTPAITDRQAASNELNLSDTNLLNLSPQTLSVLNGVEQQPVDITAELFLQTGNVPVDQAFQQQLSSILAPFANAPFSDNTFIQIQDAITAAGINPEQVSMQEVLNALTPYSLISGEILTNDTTETDELLAA